ncbi:MAG TPA: glycosyl hydrolase family 65 protein [Candidatus Limnocylindrales bacterium]|nr:glycosyl hydrolase family 65 protein [Candidatus Limnocylindrales bacterium]
MSFPDRTFEALIFDWDGTAVPDRRSDASRVRARVEALSRAGVHVAVVSGTQVGNIDGQLRARPMGPGRLYLCLNRGSEVFAVDHQQPQLVWRRSATPDEEACLDRAAVITASRLAAAGLRIEIISDRLNRRKLDLIPEPAWADPPKARIAELLVAVTERLRAHGIRNLAAAVEIAVQAARDAGLRDPRVTSDAKHVEIGLTDKSDSARWVLNELAGKGIGPGLVMIAGDEFGGMGGARGSDAWMLIPETIRSVVVSVGREPEGVPRGVVHLEGGPAVFQALLDDQLDRRAAKRVPAIDEDPAWILAVDGDAEFQRVHESLLTLADGSFGTRGSREEDGEGSDPLVLAQGVYAAPAADGLPALLPAPIWSALAIEVAQPVKERRVLDLRAGVLLRESSSAAGTVRTFRFSSLATPGAMGLRAEAPAGALKATPDLPPVVIPAGSGGLAVATWTIGSAPNTLQTVERLARYVADPHRVPTVDEVVREGAILNKKGFDQLLAEHRAAWAARWADAQIAIEGDPEAERAARFGLFHVMASVSDRGEAAVGGRGLSGRAYLGHVFWDADVYVLPVLAATHPTAARAMLEYRIQRLPAARAAAAARGLDGSRFPWESAGDGTDVTPRSARDREGRPVLILTGEHEEHITADVAWAAWHYAQWSGDALFLAGPGRSLLSETARYWASRVRHDRGGRAHLYGVEGPDEYHAPVDDDAFTNVMARWNLKRAAELVADDGSGPVPAEAARWRAIADALVDGYDPATGRYEQFAGFFELEPLVITDFAQPPVAADVLLGAGRVAGAQVIKQPDVLMLHHLVPDEVAPGSLLPNLSFYGPRTAHGSSLAPAIQAALLARAGQADAALDLLRVALRIDLDDLTGTTAGGLHLATFGGVWQALAYGFLGLWPAADGLIFDPRLPDQWRALEMTVRFAGERVRIRAERDIVTICADAAVPIRAGHGPAALAQPPRVQYHRTADAWEQVTP